MTTTSRIAAVLFAGAVGLAGCSSDTSELGRAGDVLASVFTGVIGDDEGPAPPMKVDRSKVAELSYASIGVEIGENPQFLFVLANQTATDDLYTLGYQVSLVLREGRLIRTQGFERDVLGGRWAGPNIIRQAAAEPGVVYGDRYMETSERGIGTREAHCSAQAIGDETVTILGSPIATRHVRESCVVSELKWKFDNEFWIDPVSGEVWRSIQNIHPKVAPIVIETFRPSTRPAS